MNSVNTIEDIKRLGTILCVGAHPDDETWIAGGLLAAAASNGQRVVVVTATKGESGEVNGGVIAKSLAHTRAQELHAALAILGVTEHTWLDCLDGACHREDCDMMAARLATYINDIQPDSLLTFGPEGLTGHNDHSAVSDWCSRAILQADVPVQLYHVVHTKNWYEQWGRELHQQANVFFNIDEPPFAKEAELAINFRLPSDIADRKLRALEAQPSQMEGLLSKFEGSKLPQALAQECFVRVMFTSHL